MGFIGRGINTVRTVGNQTATGVKTFTDSPLVPNVAANNSSTKAANTAFVSDAVSTLNSAVVHIAGTESITGAKTFNSTIKYSGTAGTTLNMTRTDIDFSNYVTSTKNIYAGFFDKNNEFIGGLQSHNTTTATQIKLMARKQSDTTTDLSALPAIGISWGTTGDAYGIAPASDVNGSIVTTVNKTKAQNGYLKLGNGVIMQWGYCAGSVTTITFPTPFSNTNYSVTCTHTGDANRAITVQSSGRTTTSINAIKTSGDAFYWVAFGY